MLSSSVTGLPSTTSAAGVSTGLVRQLHGHYADVRLLAGVHARSVLLASRADPAAGNSGCRRGLSVLVACRDCVPPSVAFPLGVHGRHPDCVSRSSIPGPSMPLSTLHPATSARLEVKLVRYSFLVGLFPPRLHAGLSRRLHSLTAAAPMVRVTEHQEIGATPNQSPERQRVGP